MCNMLFSVLVRCDLQKGSDASLNTTLVVLASRPLKILEYETKGHIKGKKEKKYELKLNNSIKFALVVAFLLLNMCFIKNNLDFLLFLIAVPLFKMMKVSLFLPKV